MSVRIVDHPDGSFGLYWPPSHIDVGTRTHLHPSIAGPIENIERHVSFSHAMVDGFDTTNLCGTLPEFIALREELRARKHFHYADRIRESLRVDGILLGDSPGGVTDWSLSLDYYKNSRSS